MTEFLLQKNLDIAFDNRRYIVNYANLLHILQTDRRRVTLNYFAFCRVNDGRKKLIASILY